MPSTGITINNLQVWNYDTVPWQQYQPHENPNNTGVQDILTVGDYVTMPTMPGTDMTSFGADYEAYTASFEGYAGPEAFNAQGDTTTLVVDTLEVTGEANMDAAHAFYNATLVTE